MTGKVNVSERVLFNSDNLNLCTEIGSRPRYSALIAQTIISSNNKRISPRERLISEIRTVVRPPPNKPFDASCEKKAQSGRLNSGFGNKILKFPSQRVVFYLLQLAKTL